MKLFRSYRFALAGLLIAAWFLYFAGDGIWAPFTGDDLMNLHGHMQKSWAALALDNVQYWSTAYRPLGGLFYVTLYELFGFDPLPFRVACFALLGFNLVLAFLFSREISGSGEVALFGTLLLSYHAWFVDLYYGTGTIYDVLCFSFYFAAYTMYLRIRRRGRLPSWSETLGIVGLYVCALNAKEMAVTLPLFLLVYEVIFQRPKAWAFQAVFQSARTGILMVMLTVPYVIGKLTGSGSLIENPAYRISASPGRFLDTFHLYLNPLLYQDHVFRDSNTVQMLVAMLAFALWQRSQSLVFSWFFLLLSVLPVSFIHHYSAFFMYIPSVGWAIYAGELLSLVRKGLSYALQRLFQIREPAAAVAVVMAVLVVVLAPLHLRERVKTSALFRSNQPPSREMAAELLKHQPRMKRGARLLFVNDPFPKDNYSLLFLVHLLYHDRTVEVVRTSVRPVPQAEYSHYDAVFLCDGGRIKRWHSS